MKVGLFDSGVGGLTVLKELIDKYPHNQYYYFGDNINVPFGTKSKYELKILSENIIQFLLSKDVDIIIIACGTVSANLSEYLKNKYNIPIYDIISPTIKYLNDSNYNDIGIIATEMTVKSNIFKKVAKRVYQQACPLLVPLIEKDLDYLKELNYYISKLPKFDVLVLGCTHYSIFESYLKKININTINMGKILCDSIKIKGNKESKINLYFSKVNHQLINNIEKIIKYDYQLEELCLNYQK